MLRPFFCAEISQAASNFHCDNCTRHSARLSRLLTAGTKSLLSLIAGDTLGKVPVHSALEASKQGNEMQDLSATFVNQVQSAQQQQQQQFQTNTATYEGLSTLTAFLSTFSHTFSG